uniref:Bacteriochlorophyll 4-vinyl reductase n=1 Tax=Acidicaldus sp. TaxID=1872105 RepID=A0A8J4H6Y2_9PROT
MDMTNVVATTAGIDRSAPLAAADTIARIGPNAATQVLAAFRIGGEQGEALAKQVFTTAGVAEWLHHPPAAMVDERLVGRIHRAVRAALSPEAAARLLAEAGRLTANYLLAWRIPRPARIALTCLPPRPAAACLLPAIRRHAWTFAGSGQFTSHAGPPAVFTLTGNPLCAGERSGVPLCAWHAAVFERLFQQLVSSRAHVSETECEARGDGACRFIVDWRGRRTPPYRRRR